MAMVKAYESMRTSTPPDTLRLHLACSHAMERNARLDRWAQRTCERSIVTGCELLDLVYEGPGLTTSYDNGPVVDDVESGGAAERAGLRVGDRIASVNGVPTLSVKNEDIDGAELDAQMDVFAKALPGIPGSVVKLTVIRGGRELALRLERKRE